MTEVLGDPDAALNVDETGFPKKGAKSVGVKRQYAGCLGRTDNCQIGVFAQLPLVGRYAHRPALFLTRGVGRRPPRREEAGAPQAVVFRTKPELGLEMVRQALERGMPFRWVTADSVLRRQSHLCAGRAGTGQVVCRGYVGRRPSLVEPTGGDPGGDARAGSADDAAAGGEQTRAGG